MNTNNDQLANFRKMLSSASEQNIEKPAPAPTSAATAVKEARAAKVSEKKKEAKDAGCTIWVSQEFRKRIKRIQFWMDDEGIMDNPSVNEILEEAVNLLMEKYPQARL